MTAASLPPLESGSQLEAPTSRKCPGGIRILLAGNNIGCYKRRRGPTMRIEAIAFEVGISSNLTIISPAFSGGIIAYRLSSIICEDAGPELTGVSLLSALNPS